MSDIERDTNLAKDLNNLFFLEGIRIVDDFYFENLIKNLDKSQFNIFDGIKGYGKKEFHISHINTIKKININKKYKIFDKASCYIIEPKLDGMFINCIYINGCLNNMLTRGNKIYGNDILLKGFYVLVPNKINIPGKVEIRGELVAKKSFLGNFKHSRNIVISAASKNNIEISEITKLKFFAFEIIIHDSNIKYQDNYTLLKSLNFNVILPLNDICSNINEIKQSLYYFENIRKSLDYDIDGIVLKPRENNNSNNKLQNLAVKFSSESVQTSIESISLTTGRTGIVVPVANVKTVNLHNSVVNKVSLYSFGYLNSMNILKKNILEIEKSGDAVPVIKNIKSISGDRLYIPTSCKCGHEIEQKNKIALCINENCIYKKAEYINYIASKNILNIRCISKKNAFYIADILNVITLYDLLSIDSKINSLEIKDYLYKKIGKKSINEIVKSINMITSINIKQLILCMNIEGIGNTIATKIFNFFISNNIFESNDASLIIKNIVLACSNFTENYKKLINNFFLNENNIKNIKNIFNKIILKNK